MAKFKTKIKAHQLLAFREMLERCLTTWHFDQYDRIYKHALVECLTVVRRKLVAPEYKPEFKITFSEIQALAIYWFWQQISDEYAVTDFSNKLHLMALDIHQQYS